MEMTNPVEWVGTSKRDLKRFPAAVQDEVGFALYQAQIGRRYRHVKSLKGFGANVLEIISRHDGDAYRAVYTVRFKERYMSCMLSKKKAKRGVSTPKQEIDLVRRRLMAAEQHYKEFYGER